MRAFAGQILKEKWVKPNKRIFDNSKISDHFAIIPTLQQPKSLNELEAKLYDLVVKRFLAVFYPPAEYLLTTRITRVAGEPFKTEGKVLVDAGLARGLRQGSASAPMTDAGDGARRTRRWRPRNRGGRESDHGRRARFTEATLLSAMEGAGKTDRGRRAARGDARKGTRHAGHARADHRRPDLREIHPSRRARAARRPRRRFR
mgnify:CR=1 FL=1